MRVAIMTILCLSAPLASMATLADDTLRCGNRLVRTGDGKDKVRALCGDPSDVALRGVIRGPNYDYRQYDYSWVGPTWVDVPVEIWTYNLGSQKLLRKLRFVGEELVEINTDGYGY
jgi:Protein of unknown function (DUF2845)